MLVSITMKCLILAMTLFGSSMVFACGLHQETGFSFVSEPGSLEVFEKIIISRQNQELGNPNKPDHFKLFSIKAALASLIQIAPTLYCFRPSRVTTARYHWKTVYWSLD